MNECIRTAEQALATEDMMAAGAGMAVLAVWMIIFVIFFIIIFAIAVALYVLTAIPIHKMAKRTGLPNPWLAWIPIGHTYLRLKLSKREFNIFNVIKTNDRTKAFYGYLWIMGGMALVILMLFVPVVNFFAIFLYYVMMMIYPIIIGVFMWRVNYDLLMSYGQKENAMWISVLNYWCPYFMIYMTYKIMNSDPVGDMEACGQRVNSVPANDINVSDKKEDTTMGANFKGEHFYPVELGYFAQKLRMIGKTDLKIQYKEEKPVQNGLEVKLAKDMSLESWGENITVTLTGYSNGTHIRIYSECSAPIQLVDWGINEKNIRSLFRYFEYGMPGRSVPKPTV